MTRSKAFLAAVAILGLACCSKAPPVLSGSGALKLKNSVWATYGWSHNRMVYIIYFVPSTGQAFNPDGVAATATIANEGDTFEGGLDGYVEKSKVPFKCEPKTGILSIEGKPYRLPNGSVFLVKVGAPTKVRQISGIAFNGGPKVPDETPGFMESEVARIAKDPKVKEFPKDPATDTPKNK
jgi:hypothetical protein